LKLAGRPRISRARVIRGGVEGKDEKKKKKERREEGKKEEHDPKNLPKGALTRFKYLPDGERVCSAKWPKSACDVNAQRDIFLGDVNREPPRGGLPRKR